MTETIQRLPPGLFHAFTNLVMGLYKGDSYCVEELKIFVTRYFPDMDLKQTAAEMTSLWNASSDLMSRLGDEELHKILTHPTEKSKLKLYLGRLENDIVGYAGEEVYDAFLKTDEAEVCETPLQTGFLIWAVLKGQAWLKFLVLLHKVMRKIEAFAGADLPASLGSFVALQAEKYFGGIIQGDDKKFDEERTALMTFAAAAIYPNSVFNIDNPESQRLVERIMECAVRLTGFRFATHFSFYLMEFERKARTEWFELWNSETVAALQSWIQKGTETTGYRRTIILVPQAVYDKEQVLSKDGYYEGPFPTPFLQVPSEYWKRAVLREDTLPTDILQGTIPLEPLDSRYLDLTSSMKQVSTMGIVGPHGSGKCLAGDNEILTADGNLVTVKEAFVKQLHPCVISLDASTLKLHKDELIAIKSNGLREVYCLRVDDGSEVRLTSNHPVFSIDGWKNVSLLHNNDWIGLPRCLPISGEREIVDSALIIMAYMLSEGTLYRSAPRFTNSDSNLVTDMDRALREHGLLLKKLPNSEFNYYLAQINLNERPFGKNIGLGYKRGVRRKKYGQWRRFCEIFGLRLAGSRKKQIPPIIFQLTNRQIALFLNRLFAGDGEAYWHNAVGQLKTSHYRMPQIGYASTSKVMLRQVKYLLLRLGIKSTVRSNNHELLLTTSSDLLEFINLVGIFSREKILNDFRVALASKKRPLDVGDPIPIRTPYVQYGRKHDNGPEKYYVKQYRVNQCRSSVALAATILENKTSLSYIAKSDLTWCRIKSIELAGFEETFDVQVRDNHNLIVNGIIVHNSTFQDSVACWSIDRGYVVLRLSSPRDQGLTVILPTMPNTKEGKHDWEYLTKRLKLRPRGFPAKFVTIFKDESDLNPASTYTEFDVFYHVSSLESFHLDWKKLLSFFNMPPTLPGEKREKEVSESGYLMFRQLSDSARTDQMRTTMIQDFFDYRLNNRSKRIRLQVDEIQELFGALFSSPGEAAVVRTMQSNLADIRGLNLNLDFGAIRPASLQPEILEYVTTFCFGELRESGAERTHSTRGRILEAIEPRLGQDKAYIPLLEKIMENIPLRTHHLFFMLNTDDGTLRLVRPTLPPHAVENPRLEPRRQFELFKEETGIDLLVNIDEVPRIDAENWAKDRGKDDLVLF